MSLELLGELNQKLSVTVILITHNNAITAIANRVATIRDGRIVSVSTNEQPATVDEIQW